MKKISLLSILIIAITAIFIGIKYMSSDVYFFKPGEGVAKIKIGYLPPMHVSDEILVFPNENGKVEALYTESKKYTLKINNFSLKVGDQFSEIESSVASSLEVDSGTSDILKDNWYISKNGYLISAENGIITGIGVCAKK